MELFTAYEAEGFPVTTPGWEPSLGGFPAVSAMPGQSKCFTLSSCFDVSWPN
jgi:hypothetical protein